MWALANKRTDEEKIKDKKCDARKCKYKHKNVLFGQKTGNTIIKLYMIVGP